MKIKFLQFEYEFDKGDAQIIIPILLLGAALLTTKLNPTWLIGTAVLYYLGYFFVDRVVEVAKSYLVRRNMRCPSCKNRKIFLQGYQTYKSDEEYAYYFCDDCKTTSILTDAGLYQIDPPLSRMTPPQRKIQKPEGSPNF